MIPIAVWATIMTVIPGFLAGALAVQVADEFMVSESVYGWALGAFFLAATAGSIGLGRLAQRVGARSQMIGSLAVSSVASWAIVGAARSFTVFAVLLAVSGLANSANQSAVNLLLSRADLPRLGLAMALKQSGMPVAALLGGLAVPAIATTVGWRWAYATCAVGALAAILVISSKVQKDSTQEVSVQGKADRLDSTERDMKPATPLNSLVRAAIGFGCLAYAAGSLNAWIVSSAVVHSGISAGRAGLLLSLGAGGGVAIRLFIGVRLDALRWSPMFGAAGFCLVGTVGVVLLAVANSTVTVIATTIAFGFGWVWPVFTNFAVVRANRQSAAAATGITQTGVYVGVFSGPLLSGYLIDWLGYSQMWLVTAAFLAVGAAITWSVAKAFPVDAGQVRSA